MSVKSTNNEARFARDLCKDIGEIGSTFSSLKIDYARVGPLLAKLEPVSLPFIDLHGKIIQLWKYDGFFIASVTKEEKEAANERFN